MGKVALITGAAGGIGKALCETFREADYTVFGLDRIADPEESDPYYLVDLRELCRVPECLTQLVEDVRRRLAGGGLAALIHNAAHQVVKPIETLTISDWTDTLDVNLLAPFLLSQALLPELESVHGCIINISSIHAMLSKPSYTCYATSKAALSGLTRCMAIELGGRVRVNAIAPAAVATPMLREGFPGRPEDYAQLGEMHPLGRIADPKEVAAAALFLCSPGASFVNGAVLNVDSGISARLHDPE